MHYIWGGDLNAVVSYAGSCTQQFLSYSKNEQDTLLHERFQRLYLPLSTESPLRLISHTYTFHRRTQIIRNPLTELMNDSPPSHPILLCEEPKANVPQTRACCIPCSALQVRDKVPFSSRRNYLKESISRAMEGLWDGLSVHGGSPSIALRK